MAVERPLHFATIAEVGALLRAGETTSVALTRLMLDRIAAHDGKLNAYVTVTEEAALEAAAAADRALASGEDRGPLQGVPLAIKDLLATEGVRTTCGSKLYADWVPDADATAVARLKAAGAVILGKTGLHELAYGVTSNNPHFGAIHNPWNLDCHPGGSSGGSAAAVAAGLAYGALGSDTGCSIRQPAHCCGIVGFKPSFGLVSKAGALPLVWTMDHIGPMTRTVADAALLLAPMAGHDPADPYSADRPLPADFLPSLPALEGLRLGVPRRFFFEGGDPEVLAMVEAALTQLAAAGAALVPLALPDLDRAFEALGATFLEAAAVHEANLRDRPEAFSPAVRAKLKDRGAAPLAYVKAQHFRQGFRPAVARAMQAAGVATILTPTATAVATPIDEKLPDDGLYSWHNTSIFDFTGQPSLSLPIGTTAAGLPAGLMVTGQLFEDATVLATARALEQALPWQGRTPPGF